MFEDLKKGEMEHYMNINFWGCVNTVKASLFFLKKSSQQSRIVFVGSMLSLMGLPSQTAYVSSKFALRGFAESLNYELYPQILVSIVFPPDTKTDQYLNEKKEMDKFPMLKTIQGKSKLILPTTCANGIVDCIVSGSYIQWWTIDGFILSTKCHGMEPRSYLTTLFSIFFGWLLEIIAISYSYYWHKLSKKYNIDSI